MKNSKFIIGFFVALCSVLLLIVVALIYYSYPRSEKHIIKIIEKNNFTQEDINISLNYSSSGWQITIGDPRSNHEISNELIEIYLTNTSNDDLYFMTTLGGSQAIRPNERNKWFYGPMADLWAGKTRIWVTNYNKSKIDFTLTIKFLNIELNLINPIYVTAFWTDNP